MPIRIFYPIVYELNAIGARFAQLNKDLTSSSQKINVQYTSPMNTPIDRRTNPFAKYFQLERSSKSTNTKWAAYAKHLC